MHIEDSLVEKYLASFADKVDKIERYRCSQLRVQKMVNDIGIRYKDKNFNVEIAIKQIHEEILANIV